MPFSVLMSLYSKERPEYLRQSLVSIYNQTLVPDEVVMVIDGPISDDLQGVVTEFVSNHTNLKIIPLLENLGLGKALNEGLNYCTNDLIARMDTDDICKENRFETQIKFMEGHPEIDICSSWIEEFEESPQNVISIKTLPESHTEISSYIKKRNPINHPSSCFRKQAVLNVGGYKHFPLFEDWYLWARMFVAGSKFANITTPLLYFRTSKEMFKRRGGVKYALNNMKFQLELHKLGITSLPQSLVSGTMRGFIYILPNFLRALIYKKLLRS